MISPKIVLLWVQLGNLDTLFRWATHIAAPANCQSREFFASRDFDHLVRIRSTRFIPAMIVEIHRPCPIDAVRSHRALSFILQPLSLSTRSSCAFPPKTRSRNTNTSITAGAARSRVQGRIRQENFLPYGACRKMETKAISPRRRSGASGLTWGCGNPAAI